MFVVTRPIADPFNTGAIASAAAAVVVVLGSQARAAAAAVVTGPGLGPKLALVTSVFVS